MGSVRIIFGMTTFGLAIAGGALFYAARMLDAPITAQNVEARAAQLCRLYEIAAAINARAPFDASLPPARSCGCLTGAMLRTMGPASTAELLDLVRLGVKEKFGLGAAPAQGPSTAARARAFLQANEYLIRNAGANCAK